MGSFFIVVVIAVVFVAIVYGYLASEKRRKELCAWAISRGLTFSSTKDRGMANRFTEFKCLHQGHSRYAYNIMRGNWRGQGVLLFDYHYATGSGKNRSDHHFSAAIATAPYLLQPLMIRPEGLFDKITEFFGWDDIDFESAEFSRKFYVTSPDRKWAYDVIHQRMMDYLLASERYTVQFDFHSIIATRSKQFSPREFEAAAEFTHGILQRMPEYVVRRQKGLSEP